MPGKISLWNENSEELCRLILVQSYQYQSHTFFHHKMTPVLLPPPFRATSPHASPSPKAEQLFPRFNITKRAPTFFPTQFAVSGA